MFFRRSVGVVGGHVDGRDKPGHDVLGGGGELDRNFRASYDIIGKERSTPERMPVGQREVTVLSLV